MLWLASCCPSFDKLSDSWKWAGLGSWWELLFPAHLRPACWLSDGDVPAVFDGILPRIPESGLCTQVALLLGFYSPRCSELGFQTAFCLAFDGNSPRITESGLCTQKANTPPTFCVSGWLLLDKEHTILMIVIVLFRFFLLLKGELNFCRNLNLMSKISCCSKLTSLVTIYGVVRGQE